MRRSRHNTHRGAVGPSPTNRREGRCQADDKALDGGVRRADETPMTNGHSHRALRAGRLIEGN